MWALIRRTTRAEWTRPGRPPASSTRWALTSASWAWRRRMTATRSGWPARRACLKCWPNTISPRLANMHSAEWCDRAARVQRLQERIPEVRRGLQGGPLHPFPRRASGPAPAAAQEADQLESDVPRPVLPGTPQRGIRRPARAAARHPRDRTGGNGALPRERLLLRGRGRRHVAGLVYQRTYPHAPVGATRARGGGIRRRRIGRVLPVRSVAL